ncbi:hypothetical protein DFH11DRAFT_1166497 [Phellopilus nigrolimitatus]|nr:hypothetical protein DFH11DRAFT_1166497 [Phellopilus nigrolimitatus]
MCRISRLRARGRSADGGGEGEEGGEGGSTTMMGVTEQRARVAYAGNSGALRVLGFSTAASTTIASSIATSRSSVDSDSSLRGETGLSGGLISISESSLAFSGFLEVDTGSTSVSSEASLSASTETRGDLGSSSALGAAFAALPTGTLARFFAWVRGEGEGDCACGELRASRGPVHRRPADGRSCSTTRHRRRHQHLHLRRQGHRCCWAACACFRGARCAATGSGVGVQAETDAGTQRCRRRRQACVRQQGVSSGVCGAQPGSTGRRRLRRRLSPRQRRCQRQIRHWDRDRGHRRACAWRGGASSCVAPRRVWLWPPPLLECVLCAASTSWKVLRERALLLMGEIGAASRARSLDRGGVWTTGAPGAGASTTTRAMPRREAACGFSEGQKDQRDKERDRFTFWRVFVWRKQN